MKLLFSVYKRTISLLLVSLFGHGCRFYPTCSEYCHEAVTVFGLKKGLFLTIKRLSRCHPFSKGGFDPLPGI